MQRVSVLDLKIGQFVEFEIGRFGEVTAEAVPTGKGMVEWKLDGTVRRENPNGSYYVADDVHAAGLREARFLRAVRRELAYADD